MSSPHAETFPLSQSAYHSKATRSHRFVRCTLDVNDIDGAKPAALPTAKFLSPSWDPRDYFSRSTRFGCTPHVTVAPIERFESAFSVTQVDHGARLNFGLTLTPHSSSLRAPISERTGSLNVAAVRRPHSSHSSRAPRIAAKVSCWRESSGEIGRESVNKMRGKEWDRIKNEDLRLVSALTL